MRRLLQRRVMQVLIASGFFESELPSYREYSYSKELSALGHDVTLMCGNRSQIWRLGRDRLTPSDPARADGKFIATAKVRLLRRRVLFRYSDFVFYLPSIEAIRRSDVVHVIEFRQGVTLIVAMLAFAFSKPVVYDHEQRGDRTYRWYSRVDSIFRRVLVFFGSWFVDCVRHTVLANREHFQSCSPRKVRMVFAPLGADSGRFYFDAEERSRVRAELGLKEYSKTAVMSGKLHAFKKVVDVVQACRQAGVRLILIGSLSPDVADSINSLGPGNEILLEQGDADRLRAVYCAADMAIFTTFTLSYWEAYATGLQLVVPATEFSHLVFHDDACVARYGSDRMFRVDDEEYLPGISIVSPVAAALLKLPDQHRTSRSRYSARAQAVELATLYRTLVMERGMASGG